MKKWHLAFIAALLSPAALLMAQAPSNGLLFHASFDAQERKADYAAANPLPTIGRFPAEDYTSAGGTYIDGKFGKALAGVPAQTGSFDALGNINPARGTVAFFLRQQDQPYGFEPFVLSPVDNYYWLRYIRLELTRTQNLRLSIPNEIYRPVAVPRLPNADDSLPPGQWKHIAIVWDQAIGARLYIDAKEVAGSWDGSMTWLSRGVDPNALWLKPSAKAAYDEIYIFDCPLSQQEISSLAATNTPPASTPADSSDLDAAHRANRLKELSWEKIDPNTPPVTPGKPTVLTQAMPTQSRAVTNEFNLVFDGKLGSAWPGPYNPGFNNGDGLHVQLPQTWDLLAIEGYFQGSIFQGHNLTRPSGQTPLIAPEGKAFLEYQKPATQVAPGWIGIYKQFEPMGDARDRETVTQGRVCELNFYKTGNTAPTSPPAQTWHLGPAASNPAADALGAQFTGRYWPGDRSVFSLNDKSPAKPSTQQVSALRYHHILIPPQDTQRVLSALRLSLAVSGNLAGNALTIQIQDPDLPQRRLMLAGFAIQAGDSASPQLLDITLEPAARTVAPGKPVWLTLAFKNPVNLHFGPDGSKIAWYSGDLQHAIAQQTASDTPFILSRFSDLSSPRPWSTLSSPETTLPVNYRLAGEMFVPMVRLRALAPQSPLMTSLWAWTHKETVDTSAITPLPVPGNPSAPAWVLLQRELYNSCRDVFLWWIDNRQTPDGEFGDDINDDTDFIQEFPRYVLTRDPAGKMAAGARAVLEAAYRSRRLEKGVNANTTDTLHAYEEGTNALGAMSIIDFGSPRQYERLMEASRTVEEVFTRIDAKGRRRFRSGYLGLKEVQDQNGAGVESFNNGLFVQPALLLSYYANLPRARAFAVDYLNGWLDYFEEAQKSGEKRIPAGTLMDGTVVRWDRRVRGFGFASLFAGVASLTGEDRHKQAVKYWTDIESGSAEFRSNDALASLEMVDRRRFKKQLLTWSSAADLTRPYVDRFGHIARQAYMSFELTGEDASAISALEASLRNIRTLKEAYTRGEPQNDRIYPADQVAAIMALGELPYERNQTWPRHYVSYHGLTDFAAWVREKSDTSLNIWVYNFAGTPASGIMRTWRTPLGKYTVTTTPVDASGKPTGPATSTQLTLHRAAAIPLAIPPHAMVQITVTLQELSKEDFFSRPDIAIEPADITRIGDALNVTVHNLGSGAAGPTLVQALDGKGAVLSTQTVSAIPSPGDLTPRHATVTLSGPAISQAVTIKVKLADGSPDLYELNNTAAVNP